MLLILLTAAFAAAPLMLCVPPIRSLCACLQTTEFILCGAMSLAFIVHPILSAVVSLSVSLLPAAARS